jgi:hypothetical protein
MRAGLAAALISLTACVPGVGTDDRPCPCAVAQGFVCCERVGRCLLREEAERLACAIPADGPASPPAADGRGPTDTAATPAGDGAPVTADSAVDGAANPPLDAPADVSADVSADLAADLAPDLAPASDGATAPTCASGGNGVRASYYPSRDFTGTPLVRTERGLIQDWADGSPHPSIPGDGFTARFSAQLLPEATGDYTFFVASDDGFRLWLDGELTLEWWGVTARPMGANAFLQAGRRHDLLVEYFENVGDAALDVTWKRPGTPRTAIPQCAFFASPGSASGCPSAPETECVPAGTPPCPATGAGTGLRATYYRWPGLTDVAYVKDDTAVRYDRQWIPEGDRYTQKFNARWEGLIEAPSTERYTFFLIADGHAELTIEGQRATTVFDDSASEERSVTVSLTGGRRHPIRIEYSDGHEAAYAYLQLRWKSPTMPKGAVPTCRLHPRAP